MSSSSDEKRILTGSVCACAWVSLDNCSLSKLIFFYSFSFFQTDSICGHDGGAAERVRARRVRRASRTTWAGWHRPPCCAGCQAASPILRSPQSRRHRDRVLLMRSHLAPLTPPISRCGYLAGEEEGLANREKAGGTGLGVSMQPENLHGGYQGTRAGGDMAAVPRALEVAFQRPCPGCGHPGTWRGPGSEAFVARQGGQPSTWVSARLGREGVPGWPRRRHRERVGACPAPPAPIWYPIIFSLGDPSKSRVPVRIPVF